MIDALGDSPFEFTALAPDQGRLASALEERSLAHVPLDLRDADGMRLPREAALDRLLAAVQTANADVVHANSLAMGRLTGALTDQIDVPIIAHLRDIVGLSRAAIDDLNRNRLLIAVSEATRVFHVGQGLADGRVRVVHNGVDCDTFRPRPAAGALRRELGLPDDAFLIATIGQIALRKGQDVLAEAATLAAPRMPSAHYLLVGERHSTKAESIDFERGIVDRFESAGLGNHLHRLGYRSDVAQILAEADLLVHPAKQEPLGRVLLESAACGTPTVATHVGGTAEIHTDGETARLVPKDDPHALAEAMCELFLDDELRERLSRSARLRAQQKFNVGIAAKNMAAIWQEVATA